MGKLHWVGACSCWLTVAAQQSQAAHTFHPGCNCLICHAASCFCSDLMGSASLHSKLALHCLLYGAARLHMWCPAAPSLCCAFMGNHFVLQAPPFTRRMASQQTMCMSRPRSCCERPLSDSARCIMTSSLRKPFLQCLGRGHDYLIFWLHVSPSVSWYCFSQPCPCTGLSPTTIQRIHLFSGSTSLYTAASVSLAHTSSK